LLVTSGDKGMSDLSLDRQAFCRMREAEQEASARLLGVAGVTFLHQTDGEVFDTLELRALITAEIRRHRPDLLITHDPLSRLYRQHPDHRATGFAALHAAFPSVRLPTFFPEQAAAGLMPHVVRSALLFGTDRPDVFVDIAPVFDRKIAALEAHISQTTAFPGGLYHRIRRRAEELAAPADLALAEAFLFVDLE
jgi:LmbE family N-acetylglucosaminyl deacetylase